MNAPKLRFKEFSDEWKRYKLQDLCNIYLGVTYTPTYVKTGKIFISSKDISKGYLDLSESKYISLEEYNKISSNAKPKKGDVLFTRVGSNLGNPTVIETNVDLTIFVSLGYLRVNKLFNNYFSKYWMQSNYFWRQVESKVAGGAKQNLNTGWISKFDINVPIICEQEKISKTLQFLDKKIELQSKKIEDLKLFKLYTKNQIFNDYDEVFKLKDILVKWNKKNKNNSVKYVESISNKYGFISQSDQFEDRNVASKNLNNYYIIEKGVFGYNPSRLNVGSLALKTNDKISVVSPLYECFTTSQNNQYLLEWFNSKYFRKETISKFEGGVRNTLNFSNLCEIEIRLPIIEKQNKYSNIFKVFNNKIELEVKKLYKLQELKKGLMQNMFV